MADENGRREEQVSRIRRLREALVLSRTEYEFQLPSLVSHATDYAEQPERLARYAATVIPARMMQLMSVTFMKTHHFIDCYLHGVDQHNPFASLLAARCQMEVFAVTWDVKSVLESNQGAETPGLADRVRAVDEALIGATYGTRSKVVKDFLRTVPGVSPLREVREADLGVLEARNVLTRIDRVDRSGVFQGFRETYERLCEYLHPNIGQNIILHVPSGRDAGWVRLERSGATADSRAQRASALAMAESAERTIGVLEREFVPPFGFGPVVIPK